MGIYDNNLHINYRLSYEKLKLPLMALGALVALAIIVLILLSLASMFGPKAIDATFERNPIASSEQTVLVVTITNITQADASNVVVEVGARDRSSIAVSPQSQAIPLLERERGRRILRFMVNPVGNIAPGNYVIDISAGINDKHYYEEVLLTVHQ